MLPGCQMVQTVEFLQIEHTNGCPARFARNAYWDHLLKLLLALHLHQYKKVSLGDPLQHSVPHAYWYKET